MHRIHWLDDNRRPRPRSAFERDYRDGAAWLERKARRDRIAHRVGWAVLFACLFAGLALLAVRDLGRDSYPAPTGGYSNAR